jgi:hypothetical protein
MEPSILYFDTVVDLATYSNKAEIFMDNKENAAFSKSDHKNEFRMNNKFLIERFSIIYR